MELQVLLQLVLVVLVEQEILLFAGQGLEGLVAGPEEGDRSVDRVGDEAQQACILKHREQLTCTAKRSQETQATQRGAVPTRPALGLIRAQADSRETQPQLAAHHTPAILTLIFLESTAKS